MIISWLPLDNTLIAPSQALAAPGNLSLNSKVPGQPSGAFVYDKVIRVIRLTSTQDVSAINFTVTGIGTEVDANGNPTGVVRFMNDEVIQGPTNVLPRSSARIYQQIISISADAPVANISVGSGASGITDFVFLNYKSVYGAANCSIQFVDFVNISATGYVSLNKPQMINYNAGNLASSPFMANEFIASTQVNTFKSVPKPSAVCWLSIKDTTTDSINFTVLEQGVYP